MSDNHPSKRQQSILDVFPLDGHERTLKQIAHDFGCEKSAQIGNDVDRLVERGFVEKTARGVYRRTAKKVAA